MKDRIAKIMKMENMSQQDFAAALEISPSTLSSIFNDRTQPSLTIVNKIHERFPDISLKWLLDGTEPVYEHTSSSISGLHDDSNLFSDISSGTISDSGNRNNGEYSKTADSASSSSASGSTTAIVPERIIEKVKYIDKPIRRITEINVYFDDGTYEVFVPRKKENP